MANYSFVIDSSFKPFEMQELLQPFMLYKDVYDKTEEAYNELGEKANAFKSLVANLDDSTEAKQIYNNYVNDLETQATDFSMNGLSMNNRRALTNLKRRYSGEIGRLDDAKKALEKEKDLRNQMRANGTQMLYANDNLNIDDFLDGKNPNLYGVSTDKLRQRGIEFAKQAAGRKYKFTEGESTLGGYYRKWIAESGYDAKDINDFINKVKDIPEFSHQVDEILDELQVTENLGKGTTNYEAAKRAIINGMVDGATYTMNVTPMRDLGQLTKSEETSFALQKEQMMLNERARREQLAESRAARAEARAERAAQRAEEMRRFNITQYYANQERERKDAEAAARGITYTRDSKGRLQMNIDPSGGTVGRAARKQGVYNAVYNAEVNKLLQNKYPGYVYDGKGNLVQPKATSTAESRAAKKVQDVLDNPYFYRNQVVEVNSAGKKSVSTKTYKKTTYTPFYGESLFRGARNGFDVKNKWTGDTSDAKLTSFDNFTDTAQKELIKHARNMLGDMVTGFSDTEMRKVMDKMYLYVDDDHWWQGDNHYAMTVPGYDVEGKAIGDYLNEQAYQSFLHTINDIRNGKIKSAQQTANRKPVATKPRR